MNSPTVKVAKALEKIFAAKCLLSKLYFDDDPQPEVNVSYNEVLNQFIGGYKDSNLFSV